MPVLTDLIDALRSGRVQVVDLTAPLHSGTPILQLPPPFANASPFGLTEISHYDERGPAWYWNDIHTSEHTGTHFDAPIHWVTGKDGEDVAQVPPARLVAPAAVLDFSTESDPDFLLEVEHVAGLGGRARPAARRRLAALPHRLGRPQRGRGRVPERQRDRPAHAGDLRASAPAGWPRSPPVIGVGVETVGTDAGAAHSFDPPFPCHSFLLGAGKYGLTQLQNLALLPTTGAVVVAGPLPIVNGSGQPGAGAGPGRVVVIVAELVGRTLAELGVGHAFGVVGSGNFHVTNALRAAGVPYLAARHEGGAATMADAYARTSGRVGVLTVHQGCGLTNAMTGITEAAKSRTPMLVLAADTGAAAVRSNFRIDQSGLVAAGRARWPSGCTRPASAVADTVRAYRTAVEQRRTVVLNLPLDVQAQPAPEPTPLPDPPAPLGAVRPAADGVRTLAAVIADGAAPGLRGRSRRPGGAGPSCGSWPRRPVRCWPRRPWRTGCSTTRSGRWASPAASPPRWPPS